jgi:hypothetical protein
VVEGLEVSRDGVGTRKETHESVSNLHTDMSFSKGQLFSAEAAGSFTLYVSEWRKKLLDIRKEVDKLLELMGHETGSGISLLDHELGARSQGKLDSALGIRKSSCGLRFGRGRAHGVGPSLFVGAPSSGLKCGGSEASVGLTDRKLVSVELRGQERDVTQWPAAAPHSPAPSVVAGDFPETLPAPEFTPETPCVLADGSEALEGVSGDTVVNDETPCVEGVSGDTVVNDGGVSVCSEATPPLVSVELGGQDGGAPHSSVAASISSVLSVVDGDCSEALQTPEFTPEFSPGGTVVGQVSFGLATGDPDAFDGSSGARVVNAGGAGQDGCGGCGGPISGGLETSTVGLAGPISGGLNTSIEGECVNNGEAGHAGCGGLISGGLKPSIVAPSSGSLLGGQEEGECSVPSKVFESVSPAWVLDMVSSVGNMVGLSCGGQEDKLRDLFAALEWDRVQPCSKKSRKSKGKMIRELQGLKSSVNYDGAPSIVRKT